MINRERRRKVKINREIRFEEWDERVIREFGK